jgi:hypothetical protein
MRLALLAAFSITLLGCAAAPASSCPPGFAALQGSVTCVRISGRVRGETTFGSPRIRESDALRSHVGGRIQLEIRKQTEYGPLRAVIRGEGLR